ncbi:hypothetical protein EVAR_13873_1 [Eumeta japonica]|uniref:Uncharacterized protein n=1 Tax=Eumeta variegata TaxID=151549 RepID=A0A4C1U180_EUMVA|nr:hypothetical protein EVAR_13873_1 [Eumeta japonica]
MIDFAVVDDLQRSNVDAHGNALNDDEKNPQCSKDHIDPFATKTEDGGMQNPKQKKNRKLFKPMLDSRSAVRQLLGLLRVVIRKSLNARVEWRCR